MNVIVDDLLINYELIGQGPLVLFLHGWGDKASGLSILFKSLNGFTKLAVDLPGFGASEQPKEPWNLDNYSVFLADLLKKLNLDNPYAVIGHSNGGALAIRAIAINKVRTDKLILIAASGIREVHRIRRLCLKIIAKVGNLLTLGLPERYRQALRKSLYGVAGSDMLVEPKLKETFKRTVRQDVKVDATKLTIPTLLIYAFNDKAVPINDGRTYNKLIKNSKLEIIENASHFIHLDQPDKVSLLIKEFLS